MYNVFFDATFTMSAKNCAVESEHSEYFPSELKKVMSYQHRDSLEPAQSCPVVFLVSAAPAQAGKVCPEPWSHQSPVNEIWGEVLNVFISFSFYTFFLFMLFIFYVMKKIPIANSSGISHCGRHDEERVGWYSILETVDVTQKVGQVEAHS